MEAARYYVALMVLISYPPALLLWFAIHPYASFWRKLGAAWTYVLLCLPLFLLMAVLFAGRRDLLSIQYGTSRLLLVASAVSLAAAVAIALKRRRQLTFGVLAGLPELSPRRYPGELLTGGIYARIRHPRYVEIFFWVLGYALFSNYLAIYLLVALSIPLGYLVVLIEERELRERFGSSYEEYCRRVPRFWPARRRYAGE